MYYTSTPYAQTVFHKNFVIKTVLVTFVFKYIFNCLETQSG